MLMKISEYHEACESYDGYCKNCDDIGRFGETEPDAQGYECEECGKNTCMGVEMAFMVGDITIDFNEE